MKLKEPVVTVITATFNRAHLLCGAIESVLAQNFKNFQYFIIDDGSIDDTKQKVMPYLKDPRVFYFRKKNGGQASALNLGLRFVRSQWVAFLDSDDEYTKDHLEYLLSKAKSKKNIDFVVGSFKLPEASASKSWVVNYYEPNKLINLKKVEVVLGTLAIKTDRAIKLGGFQGTLSDIDLVNRLKKSGSKYIKARRPTLKYYFGRTSDSMSVNFANEKTKSAKRSR